MSTVRRQIQERRLFAKKFGRHWYIQPPEGTVPIESEPPFEEALTGLGATTRPADGGNISSIVEFSSKALHHYLLMSEKLIAEKDVRLAERDQQITERKQEIADLKNYAKLLEEALSRQKEKPDGWR